MMRSGSVKIWKLSESCDLLVMEGVKGDLSISLFSHMCVFLDSSVG